MSRSAIVLGDNFNYGGIKFYTKPNSTEILGAGFTDSPRMLIADDGKVGIATASPSAALHVKDGPIITHGWRKTLTLEASFPIATFHSNSGISKYAGIGYDATNAMIFWVNGSTDDLSTVGNAALLIRNNGNVLIGGSTQANAAYKLDVSGKIRTNEIVVNSSGADFVFEEKYPLRSLPSLEKYIIENKHLPESPRLKQCKQKVLGWASCKPSSYRK